MKILTVCSSPYLSLEPITQILDNAGLAKGLANKDNKQSYQQWHEQVFTAYEQDCSGLLIEQALKPGKVWQDMAGQLIYANLNQKQWYWEASKAGWLLEFWYDLEPQHRFALIYSPPQIGISHCLLHPSMQNENLESVINSWINYHLELLRFYHAHQDKCILVNFEQCLAYPNEFIKICKQSLGFIVDEKVDLQIDLTTNTMQCIEDELFRLLINEYPQVKQLYEELTASATPFAQLKYNDSIINVKDQKDYLETVWKSYRKIQIQQIEASRIETTQENKLVDPKELETENELMLLQLHQVQEEFEHYFLKHQELENSIQKHGAIGFIEQQSLNNVPIKAQLIQVKLEPEALVIDLINLQWQQQTWSNYRLQIITATSIYEQITTPAAIKLPLQANNLLPLKTWPPQTADEDGAYWLIDSSLLEKELAQMSFYPEDIEFIYYLVKYLSPWLKTLEEQYYVRNNSWNEYYQVLEDLQLNLEPIIKLQKNMSRSLIT